MTTLRTWPVRAEARSRNRAALLRAAAELAEEHGYAGTSLAAVAARAGLSTGAVYSIFGSKVELFLEVLLPDWHVPQGDELPEAPDVSSFVTAYARHWVAGLRHGNARKAFELELELYLAALRDPRLLERTREIARASQQALAEHLQRLSDAGPPSVVPAIELARSVVAALQGLSQLAVAMNEEPDEEEFVRVAQRLVDTGAAPAPKRAR
jgi:AcrR family transcriptional regulator